MRDKILTTGAKKLARIQSGDYAGDEMSGIVFSPGCARRSFRVTGSDVAMGGHVWRGERECQARCINRSDTFDSSVRAAVKRAR